MTKIQTVIITKGLPGSGKTTWTKALTKKDRSFKRINRDDLRTMIYDGIWTNEREKAVLRAREAIIYEFLNVGYNIVLDDTNLDPFRMDETLKLLYEWLANSKDRELDIKIKDFTDVPLEVCLARNAARPENKRVPEAFIKNYYNKYIK